VIPYCSKGGTREKVGKGTYVRRRGGKGSKECKGYKVINSKRGERVERG